MVYALGFSLAAHRPAFFEKIDPPSLRDMLTLENNFMINRFLEAIGAEKYKTYRIYRRLLETSDSA
jgi:hypothetical protein